MRVVLSCSNGSDTREQLRAHKAAADFRSTLRLYSGAKHPTRVHSIQAITRTDFSTTALFGIPLTFRFRHFEQRRTLNSIAGNITPDIYSVWLLSGGKVGILFSAAYRPPPHESLYGYTLWVMSHMVTRV